MAETRLADPWGGARRGAALILGSGLLAGLVAAAVSFFLPARYVSMCQLRQREDAAPMLASLDLSAGGGAMRAVMVDPAVRRSVGSDAGLMQALGFQATEPTDPRFVSFYEERVSVAPFTDPNAVVVIARHEDPEMAARLANRAGAAGLAFFADRLAKRQDARQQERSARIAALEARVADLDARYRKADRGSASFRLEAEMKILLEAIEELRYQATPVAPAREIWFVDSPAVPGQFRESPWRWAPILGIAAFAAAFAALVWLARDVEPAR